MITKGDEMPVEWVVSQLAAHPNAPQVYYIQEIVSETQKVSGTSESQLISYSKI